MTYAEKLDAAKHALDVAEEAYAAAQALFEEFEGPQRSQKLRDTRESLKKALSDAATKIAIGDPPGVDVDALRKQLADVDDQIAAGPSALNPVRRRRDESRKILERAKHEYQALARTLVDAQRERVRDAFQRFCKEQRRFFEISAAANNSYEGHSEYQHGHPEAEGSLFKIAKDEGVRVEWGSSFGHLRAPVMSYDELRALAEDTDP